MATTNTNPVLGVVIIARHGDRQGFYQAPTTYTASATAVTPLGEVQSYQLGDLMRRTYAGTESTAIAGLSPTTLNAVQINSTADGGGEGGVIWDSALAFWQGFYPPSNVNDISTISLANGTNITSPLGGFQYLQINAVLPTEEVEFEGWTNCNAFNNHTAAFYASPDFVAKAAAVAPFLKSLQPIVGNRTIALSNMYNIFDFMNVQSIHNATFAALVNATGGPSTLPMVRDLASYHEYGAFTDTNSSGIGNVAGRTFFSLVLPSLQTIATETAPVKIAHYQVAYKPFLSLFNMTNIAASGTFQYPYAMVDYASVAVLEVRKNMAGTGHDVRFGFKNGTADGEANGVTYYPLWGSDNMDTDLGTFTNNIQPYIIPNNQQWCSACNNTAGFCQTFIQAAAGIAAMNASSSTTPSVHHDKVSPAVGGVIGAVVALALGVVVLASMASAGFVSFGKKKGRGYNDDVPLKQGSISSHKL